MTPQEFEKQLQKHRETVVRAISRTIPVKAGATARAHFRDNFRKGGFVDDSLKPWKPSKRIGRAKGAAGQYKTLLSGRNRLYNSINYRTAPAKTVVYTNVVYAAVHNEGLRAGRGRGFNMPKRRFMGESKQLSRKITGMIEDELKKAIQQ